jgi:flagellar hook-length control protein FliK
MKPELVIAPGGPAHAGAPGKAHPVAKGFAEALARASGPVHNAAPATPGPSKAMARPELPPAAKAPVAKAVAAEGAPALAIIGKAPALQKGKIALVDRPSPGPVRAGRDKPVKTERNKKAAPRGPQVLPTVHAPLPGEAGPAPLAGKAGRNDRNGKNDRHPAPIEVSGRGKAPGELERAEAPAAPVAKKALPVDPAGKQPVPFTASDAPVVVTPVAPAAAAPILHQAAEDPGLRVAVLSHTANVAIEGNDGNLALHVRVKDGAADVRIGGTMAPLFETRAPEIQAALAGQGLSLGRYDLEDQRRRQDGQAHEPIGEIAPLSSARPATASTGAPAATSVDGRIHVTA